MDTKTLALGIFLMMLTTVIPLVMADDSTCPYDADYKFVLKKALIDYLQDPPNSQIQKADLIKMLNFYLVQSTITDADCSQGNITALVSEADERISDDVLAVLKCSGHNCSLPKCDACADGTACGGTNDRNQTCACKDIDGDSQAEFCHLKPVRPTWPTCDVCPDGTACGDDNPSNQTCMCKDVNNDGLNEFCFLQAPKPDKRPNPVYPWPTCTVCQDGTACGQTNPNGDECACYGKLRNGSYSHCLIKCDSCSDGTQCGDTNSNDELCGCRIRSHYGQFRECLLRCDECSDGTQCRHRNSLGDVCRCSGYYGRGYYNKCDINSNTTTTTTAVTTTIIGTTTTEVTTTTTAVTTTTLATTTTTSGTTTTTQSISCDPETLAKAVNAARVMGEVQQLATPREFGTQGDKDAATWMYNQMTLIGLTNVHYEDFTASFTDSRYGSGTITGTGINVVGDLGSGPTVIVIGAHHDAVPPSCAGAVDNAAGSASILEVAQVLSACKSKITQYTLRFVSFDGEEPNGDYFGSAAYVKAHSGDNNPTMINIDCLGYKSDKGLTVYTSDSGVSLSGSAAKACTYMKAQGMQTCSVTAGGSSVESDSASFYDAGKEYIYPIEDQECGKCNHCESCADDTSANNFDQSKLVWGAQYTVYVMADSYLK